jgi:hypothetical protein
MGHVKYICQWSPTWVTIMYSAPMTLWRVHTTAREAAADFCVKNKVVGVGWPVDATRELCFDEYCDLADTRYPGDKGWRSAVTAIARGMQPGDLCWIRGDGTSQHRGIYFLGRITKGSWKYAAGDENKAAGTFNLRPCRWIRVGDEREVPGLLPTRFIRGQTVRRIEPDTEAKANLVLYSKFLWNNLSRRHSYKLDEKRCENNWAFLLSYKDLEELLALYLQFKKGYAVLSTTWRTETPLFEVFLCSRRQGRRQAAIQVKTGAEVLHYETYSDCTDLDVFLCNSSDKVEGAPLPFVHKVPIASVLAFAEKNITQLPNRYRNYLDIWSMLRG